MKAWTILVLTLWAWAGLASGGQAMAETRRNASSARSPGPFAPMTFGRWVVDGEGEWVEASTDNGSGSEFGLLCASDCLVYLDFKIECDEGDDYPAMVNSRAGAIAISMRCHHYGERPILITEAAGEYIDMLEQSQEIGFAFPLEGGLFRVARFPTQGGYEAVQAAIRIAIKNGTLKQAPKDVSI